MSNLYTDNLISSFSIENLITFFRNKIHNFIPRSEDYSSLFEDDKYEKYQSITILGDAVIENDEIILIASETTDPITERTGKKRQYDIAKTILRHEVKDAAFFVFYDVNGNFRFSLSELTI